MLSRSFVRFSRVQRREASGAGSAGQSWRTAFPVADVERAVDVLIEAWTTLAAKKTKHFCHTTPEPILTRALKTYIADVVAPRRGVLGMWAAEGVINQINSKTLKIVEERRNDIVYGWNNTSVDIQIVFEFKKLNRLARSRAEYLDNEGLGRFVDGIYARKQAIAAMVGIVVEAADSMVSSILTDLAEPSRQVSLRLESHKNGAVYVRPSEVFPRAAEFDTVHRRPAGKAPAHGTILVSHIFLSFGYDAKVRTKASGSKLRARHNGSKRAVPIGKAGKRTTALPKQGLGVGNDGGGFST